jgi:hypothetical protein
MTSSVTLASQEFTHSRSSPAKYAGAPRLYGGELDELDDELDDELSTAVWRASGNDEVVWVVLRHRNRLRCAAPLLLWALIEDFVQGLGIEHLDRPFFQLIDIGGGQPNLDRIGERAKATREQALQVGSLAFLKRLSRLRSVLQR